MSAKPIKSSFDTLGKGGIVGFRTGLFEMRYILNLLEVYVVALPC